MNKFLFLLFLALPLFGETIKISFHRQWHPKIKGLNMSQVRFVSSKPMAIGSRNRDGSLDLYEVGLNFTPFAEHYGNMLEATEPLAKRSLSSMELILKNFIGIKSVDLLDGKFFSVETLSWEVEKLFIKNDYSVTCKTIEKKTEGFPQETNIEIFFTKN